MITDAGRVPLAGRAWIGDGVRGALIAADGTVDWYSSSGIADAPVFWRLLDPAGGALRVGPVRGGGSDTAQRLPPSEQRMLPGSNVAETTLRGPGQREIVVTDFLPWMGPGLATPGRLVRLVRARAGPIDVEVEVVPSGRFGPARKVSASSEALVFDDFEVRAGIPFEAVPVDRDHASWIARQTLDTGEEWVITAGPLGDPPLGPGQARVLLEETVKGWQSWLSPLTYSGPYRSAVERSLLAIRSSTPFSGAPRAAATTSLPRRVGSDRTSDDRWVRVRDVAAATRVMGRVGLAEDAEAAETWLRLTITEAPLPWPAWLDQDGQPVPDLAELPFEGWRRTQPVVTGRSDVLDVGVFGDVMAAVGASTRGPGGRHDDPGPLTAAFDALGDQADWIVDHWSDPDGGPWGDPAPRRPVASRLSAWYGLDRMARLARSANPLDLSAPLWQQSAKSVLAWIEDSGLAPDGGLRLDGAPGAGDEADASLVTAAWMGPWPAFHPIVTSTVDRVMERLSSGPFLHAVAEPSTGPDNPDLHATLLLVKALCRLERWEEAHERMDAVTSLGTPGLLSETVDPLSGELLGNIPATSVGLALVDAAAELSAGPE